jgi:hypothetical protein
MPLVLLILSGWARVGDDLAEVVVSSPTAATSKAAAQLAIANIAPSWYTRPPAGGVTGVGW